MGPLLQQNFSNILLEPHHNGQLHSWNVAYQRILPGAFTAEVAYVGNRAKDDWGSENINAGYVVGADREGQPLFVKYGRTASTTVQVQDSRPNSEYRSMQVKIDRRMRNGLMVTNSYTLGRAWDFNNGTPAHPDRFERGVGRTSFDSLHNFTSSFVYMLPWGPQGTWLRDGALSKVLGDWQVTGLFSAASGTPINFTAGAAGLRAPNNSPNPERDGHAEGARWYRLERIVVRHVGLLGSRCRDVGQRSAKHAADRTGLCQSRRVDRENPSLWVTARRDPSGLLQRN